MPYASKRQQRFFNAKAASGDPKFVKLARDFNQATYGRPGWSPKGRRIQPDLKAAAIRRGRKRYAALPLRARPTPSGSRTAAGR